MKMLIKRGRLVDPVGGIGGIMDLLIENGKIAGLGSDLGNEADQIIDADGKEGGKQVQISAQFTADTDPDTGIVGGVRCHF